MGVEDECLVYRYFADLFIKPHYKEAVSFLFMV